MSKNLIPQIAKMLGVELGEEFKIKGREYIFHFVDNGLVACRTDGSELPHENCLAHFLWLINGEEEIVKLPWKPKVGGTFYSFYTPAFGFLVGPDDIHNYKWKVRDCIWDDTPLAFGLFKAGWVYRTRTEAEAALPAVAKEMGVEYKI